jgi:putative glutamine amidotransferase
MKERPVILVAPSTARKGVEFGDDSISLSNCYTDALIAAGGLPQILPATTSRPVVAEALERCDGVLLTGGEDVNPRIYLDKLPRRLAKTVGPLEPERDGWECDLVAGALRQRKALFGICRGHQMLNVALGGTLLLDIAAQIPGALNHRRMDRRSEPVHEVSIAADSALARMTGRQTLKVNSTHHQAIAKVADLLRVVAQSADGIIEAVELKEPGRMPFLLAVQFHPERLIDSDAVFLQLFAGFVEACACRRETTI